MKLRVGNKENSYWNGQWAGHARPFFKTFGNRRRRRHYRNEIKKFLRDGEE